MKPIASAKGTTAFEAVTPDGYRVTYLAADYRDGAPAHEGIEVQGEALLVVRSPAAGEEITGVVLALIR